MDCIVDENEAVSPFLFRNVGGNICIEVLLDRAVKRLTFGTIPQPLFLYFVLIMFTRPVFDEKSNELTYAKKYDSMDSILMLYLDLFDAGNCPKVAKVQSYL